MRALVVLLSAFVLSGCVILQPTVVASNERYVTLRDEIGVPGMTDKMAQEHCAKYGRIAQYQSTGGGGWQCSGRNTNLCTTYSCVQ
jgi:hypothetical protein